jgi:hypothetical protein
VAVVAAEPLLVDGSAGEGVVASFIQNVEFVLTREVVFLFNVVND